MAANRTNKVISVDLRTVYIFGLFSITDLYSNSDLDAYATAASVMPKREAFTFLNAFRRLGYLVLTNDKKMVMNEGFKTLIKELEIKKIEGSSSMKPLIYLLDNVHQ